MRVIRVGSQEWERLVRRGFVRRVRVEDRVRRIVEAVRTEGDTALIRYTRRFDRVKLTPRTLRVTEAEASGAFQNISPEFVASLKKVIENIHRFYRRSVKRPWRVKGENGVVLGEHPVPLDRVGVYVPSGTAPLVSTVYMTVVPAKIAGVKEIILVTPPKPDGSIDPHILVVASLLKVSAVYKVGGAQAIAALAFGTKTIPQVDKIVGPGNAYVTEAKRQVFGYVDIDMLAGPTEIAVIANQHSDPEYVARDLEAEHEHHQGLAILITTSKALAKIIRQKVSRGYIVMARSLDEAAEIANALAPEHLELQIKRPEALIRKIKNAGAIFTGDYSPASVGDYAAGPSHVLPTGGSARFFSGLGVGEFMKVSHVISYSRKALENDREMIERLAKIEGLPKHWESVAARFNGV
ncbi:MAG: histidinol dehydrogenase [Candidatus Omnitrophica bacterium]|nr:histidinol dehydrogenase [Candidatus Omnitrophota bacterium]